MTTSQTSSMFCAPQRLPFPVCSSGMINMPEWLCFCHVSFSPLHSWSRLFHGFFLILLSSLTSASLTLTPPSASISRPRLPRRPRENSQSIWETKFMLSQLILFSLHISGSFWSAQNISQYFSMTFYPLMKQLGNAWFYFPWIAGLGDSDFPEVRTPHF